MTRLYDLAAEIRSKNAGPFTLTIDLAMASEEDYRRVLNAEDFSIERIAALYGVPAEFVRIHPFEKICTVKVSLPRLSASSGARGDCDVYGCQQHFPLAELEIC